MVFEVIRRENERLINQGRREGIREGIQEGRQKERQEIIQKLLKIGISEDIICKSTNMKKEEIEKIKKRVSCKSNFQKKK